LSVDSQPAGVLIRVKTLIQKLEAAVLSRNPGLAQLLQPGLTTAQIQKELKRGGIEGPLETVVALYSWRNGTQLQGSGAAFNAAYKGGLVPPRIIPMTEGEKEFMRAIGVKRDSHPEHYHLMDLKTAANQAKQFNSQACKGGALKGYFPFLWETGRGSAYLALDVERSGGSRVVKLETMETRDQHPVREAYDTFEDFLKDAIQCNENHKPLVCLGVDTKPIIHTQARPGASAAVAEQNTLPAGEHTLALRTDFSNEAAWESLRAALRDCGDEFSASLNVVSDPAYDGLTADQLPSRLSTDPALTFAFLIDGMALTHPEHPILVVDLHEKPGQAFRVVLAAIEMVEGNLSTANMGFDEFANAVDKDGILRGFQQNDAG
jgi:hypothetical protein